MTAWVRDCLCEYFALRIEMASAVTAPGKPGERTDYRKRLIGLSYRRVAASRNWRGLAIRMLRNSLTLVLPL
jgi:hypothetical protein